MEIGAYRGVRHRKGLAGPRPAHEDQCQEPVRVRSGHMRSPVRRWLGSKEGDDYGQGQKDKKSGKRKEKRLVPHGLVSIQATFNNTIIAIGDPEGNLVAWSSAGKVGFKGSRKGTPFAAQMAAAECGPTARDVGMRTLDVKVKGPGSGRESAIRALQAAGLECSSSIRDVTPIPHNGCRPRKRRRV